MLREPDVAPLLRLVQRELDLHRWSDGQEGPKDAGQEDSSYQSTVDEVVCAEEVCQSCEKGTCGGVGGVLRKMTVPGSTKVVEDTQGYVTRSLCERN